METPIYNPVVNGSAVRKPSKGNRKIIFLIAGLAIVFLLAAFIFIKVFVLDNIGFVAQNNVESLAKKSVEALYTGEVKTLHNLMLNSDLFEND